MTTSETSSATIGVLFGGGLDSGILLWERLAAGSIVQPFYVRSGLAWEGAELAAAQAFVAAIEHPRLQPLVVLDLPLDDLYAGTWSVTGREVPNYESTDEAVFLPARNALLLIKPIVWCQLHGIGRLELATLASNPFPDATESFFREFAHSLALGVGSPIDVVCPYAGLHKREVMLRGAAAPLELTFSCLAPVGSLHCGACNKCAERRYAFASVGRVDLTRYATAQ